ncbi:signal recognition particle-docking protein FtsY [Lapidilactobacillus bayanensis]|uniref:signal recognition particle-docking protein FtsY n=1 Tax=Lapidilactobacillus bayanensis TaxID=2485998 RepID=UPI000F789FC2|nr:signal recognition particle-docking protein FtsY [Lapidilactobacillus bayanensis]
MGFFDRVKKAFGVKPKDEETPTEQHTEQVENTTSTTESKDKTDEVTPLERESTTQKVDDQTTAHADKSVTASTTEKSVVKDQDDQPQVENHDVETHTEQQAVDHEPTEVVDAKSLKTTINQSEAVVTAPTASTPNKTAEVAATKPTLTEETAKTTVDQATESAPVSDAPIAKPKVEATMPDETTPEETAEEETTVEVAPTTPEDNQTSSNVAKYDQGLAKSRNGFAARLNKFLANFRSVDEDFFENLEEMLIEADVGFETAMEISNQLRDEVKLQNAKTKKQIGQVIVEKMVDIYGEAGANEDNSLHFTTNPAEPTIFLFVGVNGAGKTTTIGKLATKYHNEGKKVLLAAGDTFRAGAIEQLAEWARRAQVDVVTSAPGTDPASVVFDAVKKAKTEQYDILLVDTAGRLQNNINLMNELAKIKRIIVRELPDAPQEVLLVLDASTGQNALNQAKQFSKTTDVTGLILTKLDGSSKGGIIIAIRNELHLPVKLVGLGEKAQDLQIFDAEKYVYGLFKDLIED